ncbi:MAG TPA: protoporphyrinogen oxidase, partial [Anaerolineaceae bacterium]|nr:protoporphyrinogen oxidase [Anaerolineaceae bacterium]
AYHLQQEAADRAIPLRVVLLEADERLGGKILTEQVDGFTIEGGPDCFIRQKPWATELANKIGLQDELLPTNDHQRKTFVLTKGRLTPLPDGVMLIIPTRIMPFALSSLISLPGKIRMGMDWFIPQFKGPGDESVGDFVRRRLGREALEKIAEPLMSGIHVSDPEKQSLLATFPRFRALEQKHGSLIRGMLAQRKAARNQPHANGKTPSIFLSLREGVAQLTQRLEAALAGVQICKGTRVVQLEKIQQGYRLTLDRGEPILADAVILAIPAFHAAELFEPLQPQIARQLTAIPYVSTATVSLAFRKQDIRKPFLGFGFVVPRTEKRDISACTWTSFKFDHRAPDDYLLLRGFIGGPGKEELVDLDDESMVQVVRRELRSILELDAEPVLSRVYRWRKANPQYEVGHLDRVKALFADCRTHTPGVILTGSAYEGVGIPDCVLQGKKAATEAMEYLQR